MIAALFLIICEVACFVGIQHTFPKLSKLEQHSLSWLSSIILSTWLVLSIASVSNYTIAMVLTASLALGLLLKYNSCLKNIASSIKITKYSLIFLIIWLSLFYFLFSKALVPATTQGWQTLIYSYGDIPLHSTYVNYFAQQEQVSLVSPIFPQELIHYPFLSNFHAALLVKMGWTLHVSLIVTSILTITSFLILFYSFCFDITKKSITPYIASLLFFFNGGLGFYLFIKEKSLGQDFTNLPELGFWWTNVISTHLLPQRAFLFGMLAVIVFLKVWQHMWHQKKLDRNQVFFVSLLTGALPLLHSHSFLFLFPLLSWLLFQSWLYKKITLVQTGLYILPALVLGVTQSIYMSSDSVSIFLQLGWKAENQNIFSFWWNNMGISLIFFVLSPIFFKKLFKKRIFEKHLLLPSVTVFVLCNIFSFQFYDWNNIKLLLLAYMVVAVITAAVLTTFFTRIWSKIAIIILVFIAIFSGILSVLYTAKTSWTVAAPYDVTIGEMIAKITPTNALFMSSDAHNHPVTMIAGRATLRGYKGWLWSYGINYTATDQDINQVFAGSRNTKKILEKYGVTHIFVGPTERKAYQINDSYLMKHFEIIYQDDQTKIFKI